MVDFDTKFNSRQQDAETPDSIFLPLQKEFGITFDVCATEENKKCEEYYSPKQNGLSQDWKGVCWMNPPFKQQGKWIKKAYEESKKGVTVISLMPARTNTNWWHEYCMNGEIRFIRGRPKFKGHEHGLPQPLAIVIFR